MRSAYKHPKLYSDLVCLYKSYWQVHSNLPRHFQATSGLLILQQLTACIEYASAANFTDKINIANRRRAARKLTDLREALEVIRALLTVAWELRFISHHVMAHLNGRLDDLGKQATRWGQWFMRPGEG